MSLTGNAANGKIRVHVRGREVMSLKMQTFFFGLVFCFFGI